MDRAFSRDPILGVATFYDYDESTDTFVLRKEQDFSAGVEANKALYNDAPTRWGDGQLVASIPLNLYWDLKQRGIIGDQKALRRWLNDPDNRHFRTRPGII